MEKRKRPTFQKPGADDFFKQLHREVEATVLSNDRYYRKNVIKSFILLIAYFAFYAGILIFGNNTTLLFMFYILCGFTMIVLFINSFHDAAHGALFKSPKNNNRFTWVLEVFGSNRWLWITRHIRLHHPYSNIPDWDVDIKQSDMVRLFPGSNLLNVHKYQHIYMWFLYPMYSLNWLFIRDFKDFFGKKDNYVKRIVDIPVIEYYRLFITKIVNVLYMVVLPAVVLSQPWYMVLLAWLSLHICGSILGVVALLSTHVDEHAHFPTAPEDGKMPTTWAVHQLLVTKDFSTGSPLANFLYGGFTHHVAHHLFPGVGHTYYPHITPIIKRYAEENGIAYTSYPFHKALQSHYVLLKNNSVKENIFLHGEI